MDPKRIEGWWKTTRQFDPADEAVWQDAYAAAKRGAWRELQAIRAAHPEVALHMLQKDGSGYTLLHHACWHGEEQTATLLIRSGADPHATNSKGETPAQVARRKGHDVCALAASAAPLPAWTAEELRKKANAVPELLHLVAGRYRWIGSAGNKRVREFVVFPDRTFTLLRVRGKWDQESVALLWGRVDAVAVQPELREESDVHATAIRALLVPTEFAKGDEDSPVQTQPRMRVPAQGRALCWFYPNHMASLGSFHEGNPTTDNPAVDFAETRVEAFCPGESFWDRNQPSVFLRFPTGWNQS